MSKYDNLVKDCRNIIQRSRRGRPVRGMAMTPTFIWDPAKFLHLQSSNSLMINAIFVTEGDLRWTEAETKKDLYIQ